MLHKGSLLQQTNRHLRNCLLHTSNSHCCYGPQPQANVLPWDIRVSCNLYSQQLAYEANLAGNQGNLHHLGKHSTRLLSLSFQQQRHSKIMLYPTRRSQKCQNLQMGKVSKMVDQIVIMFLLWTTGTSEKGLSTRSILVMLQHKRTHPSELS